MMMINKMTIKILATTLGLRVSAAAAFAADPLPRAKPEEVGLSSERLARIGTVLKADIEAGRIPGAVIAIARHGKLVALDAYGWRDKAAGVAMTTDTIFNIASMTKPMTTGRRADAVRAGQAPDRRSLGKIFSEIRRRPRRCPRRQWRTDHRHHAGDAQDHHPGSDAPHLRADLWRPRQHCGAQDVSGRQRRCGKGIRRRGFHGQAGFTRRCCINPPRCGTMGSGSTCSVSPY